LTSKSTKSRKFFIFIDKEEIAPIHKAQLITYLKLSKKHLGFLINFNVKLLKHGLH